MLQFAITMPAGLSTAAFPPMMLQTLVENSIKHGLEPKREGGVLTLSADVGQRQPAGVVSDTGPRIRRRRLRRGGRGFEQRAGAASRRCSVRAPLVDRGEFPERDDRDDSGCRTRRRGRAGAAVLAPAGLIGLASAIATMTAARAIIATTSD